MLTEILTLVATRARAHRRRNEEDTLGPHASNTSRQDRKVWICLRSGLGNALQPYGYALLALVAK